MAKHNYEDILDRLFGTLVPRTIVPEPAHLKPQPSAIYYLCDCRCGLPNCFKTSVVKRDHLLSGNTKSCRANKKAYKTIEEVKKVSFLSIYNRGRYNDGDISSDQFISLVSDNCFYCDCLPLTKHNDFHKNRGTEFSKKNGEIFYNGLDRLNSSIRHMIDNVVPCCSPCNSFKLNRSYVDTLAQIPTLIPDFNPVFVNSITVVRKQLELLKQGIGSKSNTARTPISELYPKKYGNENRPRLQHRISTFLSMTRTTKTECNLTQEEVAELMLSNCIYCNFSPNLITGKFNGIDRYLNDIGYLQSNSVSACHYCNSAKKQLTIDEFRAWITRITTNFPNLPKTIPELKSYILNRNTSLKIKKEHNNENLFSPPPK